MEMPNHRFFSLCFFGCVSERELNAPFLPTSSKHNGGHKSAREREKQGAKSKGGEADRTCVCCICTCIQVSFVLFLFFIFAVFVPQLLDIVVVSAVVVRHSVFGAFPFQIKHSVVTFICCTLFKLVFQFCGSYSHTHTHSNTDTETWKPTQTQ